MFKVVRTFFCLILMVLLSACSDSLETESMDMRQSKVAGSQTKNTYSDELPPATDSHNDDDLKVEATPEPVFPEVTPPVATPSPTPEVPGDPPVPTPSPTPEATPPAATPSPTPEPTPDVPPTGAAELINSDILESRFLGAWGIRAAFDANKPGRKMGFSQGTQYIDSNGNLHVSTYPASYPGFGIFKRPATLSKAKDLASIPSGQLLGWQDRPVAANTPNMSGTDNHGVLETDRGLFFTNKAFYAVSGEDFPTQGLIDVVTQTVKGLFRVGGPAIDGINAPYHHNKIGGYMGYPPADIPGDYLVGLCGSAGAGSSSGGPSLYVMQFDAEKSPGQYQSAKPLLAYNITDHALPEWNNNMMCRGVAWIETPEFKGVLFSVSKGLGKVWYGERSYTDPDTGIYYYDSYKGVKSFHSVSYDQQIWVYDPEDLRAVYRGDIAPHTPKPKYIFSLSQYEIFDKPHEPVTLSYRDGRLVVILAEGYHAPNQAYESQPLVLEFNFQ